VEKKLIKNCFGSQTPSHYPFQLDKPLITRFVPAEGNKGNSGGVTGASIYKRGGLQSSIDEETEEGSRLKRRREWAEAPRQGGL